MVDCILALMVLIEYQGEFRKPFLGAYVDFMKAFGSVHRETLWELLRLRKIPEKIPCLISALYTDTESTVWWGWGHIRILPCLNRCEIRICPCTLAVQCLSGLDNWE